MAKVLSISSQVVYGYVGNSVTTFGLQRLGQDVFSLPTVILSNRPGYAGLAGTRISPDILDAMLEACLANGWLANLDAIFTGYLPSAAHVALCARWIERLKAMRPDLFYMCDPILGDEPAGVYIDREAAFAVKDSLLPLADLATPNAFELGWLSGCEIATPADAVAAARRLSPPSVLVTSAPAGEPGKLANILVENRGAILTSVTRRPIAAYGAGDFFACLFLAHKLLGRSHELALRCATAAMDAVLDASEGRSELSLVRTQHIWADPEPALAEASVLESVAGRAP